MEQTRQHKAAEVWLVAALAVVLALALFFALLPQTTMTASADSETIEIDTNQSLYSYTSGCVTITVNDKGDKDGAKVDENRLMAISVSGNVVIKNAKVRIGYYYEDAGSVRSDVCDEFNVEGSGNHNTYVTFSNVNAKKITISTTFQMVQIDHVSLELIPVNGVTYELNGGSFNGEYIDYYFDNSGLILPTNVTREQYSFVGWYDNALLTGDAVTEIGADATGDKEYWAKWAKTYSITYHPNGGTFSGDYVKEYTGSSSVTLPTNVTLPGYFFVAWYDNADLSGDAIYSLRAGETGDKEYWARWEEVAMTDVSGISANYTAQDGEVLTGTLSGTYKLSIADGATVTIYNLTVEREEAYNYYPGLNCLGDATIIVKGVNNLKGDHSAPGISPSAKTLTIKGDGTLNAEGGFCAPGIGVYDTTAGTIVIESGTIIARGANRASGIGVGPGGICSNIIITGGTIVAYGGESAAGIGAAEGWSTNVDNVTIAKTVKSVTAYAGKNAQCIGKGEAPQNMGPTTVTIGSYSGLIDGVESEIAGSVGGIGGSSYTYAPERAPLNLHLNGGLKGYQDIDSYVIGIGALPTDVTKKHYRLAGWYDNAALTGDAVTYIPSTETGEKEYWAKWEPIVNNITYHLNDGTFSGDYPQGYTETIGAKLPTNVTKAHYNFLAWYDNEELDGDAVTEITADDEGDKEYWAKWEPITHSIIYHLNGGEWEDGISAPTTFNEGEKFELVGPDCIMPVKTGYRFYGWYTSDTLDEESEIQIIQANETNDVALWAAWGLAPVAPTIEDVFPTAGKTEHKGEVVTVEATANEDGFVLDKTHSIKITFEEGLFPDGGIYLIVADKYEYYAQPEYMTSEYQYSEQFVTSSWGEIYHGGYRGPDDSDDRFGPSIGAPWPFDLKNFNGFITVTLSEEYSEKSLAFKQIHVVGHYVRNVKYNTNDGTMPEGYANKYLESRGLELPIPTRNAYAFIGWYDNEELEGEAVKKITVADTGDKEYWAKWELIKVVDLSTLEGDYTLVDGQTATGTLNGNYKISVEDGASVTLKDVTINGVKSDACQWAGITLEGSATISLEGSNTLRGFHQNYPGIFVPKGGKLTIDGTGSLDTGSNGWAPGIGAIYSDSPNNDETAAGDIVINGGTVTALGGENAAGLGGARNSSCGDITVNGGTVTATGYNCGAGLGGGTFATCGNITINGGIVTATGGMYAPGIGSGYSDACGNITITKGALKVTATKGEEAPYSIGASKNGSCGTITIGDATYTDGIADDTFSYTSITAEDVIELINALGTAEYTEEYQEKLAEIKEKYDVLSDEEKAKIDAETLKKLEDAEDAYKDLENGAKADEAADTIDALPDEITVDDKDAVQAARVAYDALTDEQKAKVDPDVLSKLEAAEKEIADIEKAAEVTEAIDKLPGVDEITLDDKDAVDAAREAYNALTDDQKQKVDPETLKKLTDAETAYATATITEELDKLPALDLITLEDRETIKAARAAYDALDEDMQGKIPQDVLDRLLAAEDRLDVVAATPVIEAINALKEADEITLDDQADVSAARAAYETLTPAQKAKVTQETLDKLEAAEQALKEYNAKVAKPVADTIDALPDEITADDKDKVQAAREAYETLTREQKACVPQETRDKLLAAEKALANSSLIGYRWYLGYSYDIDGAYFKSSYGTKRLSNDRLDEINNYGGTWYFNFKYEFSEGGGSYSSWDFTVTEGSTPTGLEVISGSGTEEDPYVFAPVFDPAPSYVSVDAMKVVKGYNVDFAVDRVVPVKAVFNPAYATDKSVRWSVEGDGVTLYADQNCTIAIDNSMTSYTTVYAKGVKLGSVVITAESLDIVGIKGSLETEVVVDQNIGMTWFLHYEHEITADRFEYRGGSGLYDINGYELIVIEPYRHMDGYYQFLFEKDGRHEDFTIYMDGETRVPTGLRITKGAGVYSDPYYIEPIYDEPPFVAVDGISLSETELDAYTGEMFVITATFDPKPATNRQVIWSATDGVELYVDKGYTTLVGEGPTDVLSVFLKGVKVGQSVVTVISAENGAATASMTVNVLDGDVVAFVDYRLYSNYSAWHGDKLIVREVGSTEPFATLTLTEDDNGNNRLYLPTDKYYELVWYGSEDAEYCGFQFINASTADRLSYVADCGEFEDGQVVATFYATNKVIVRIDLDNQQLVINEGEAKSVIPEVNPGKVKDTTMTWRLNKSGYIELYSDSNCTMPLPEVIDSRSDVYVKGLKAGLATITFSSVADPTKHAYCVVTVMGTDATADVDFTFNDSGSDGWDGAHLVVRDHESGATIESLSPSFGSTSESLVMPLPFGSYDLYWESGYADSECSFVVTIGDVTIDSADFTLQDGLLTTISLGSDEDYASAAAKLIDTLNGKEDITRDDKSEIEKARAVYEALTQEQKDLVSDETLDKLATAEKEMADIVAADEVTEDISNLPQIDDVVIGDKEAIEAARAAYEDLTDEQKAKVSKESLDRLAAAEEQIALIEKDIADTAAAKQVSEGIDGLKEIGELTLEDKEAVEAARAAYEDLTDEQKAKVSKETLDRLAAAEQEMEDIEAAALVENKIAADIPATVTLDDKTSIETARAMYEALTDEQKAKVSKASYDKLVAAEKAYKDAKKAADDKAAAQVVIDKIDALGATPTEDEVKAARAAYVDLTPDQRKLVTNLSSLTAAEEQIAAAKAAAASQKAGLTGGAIAGIVIGFVIIGAVLGLLIYSILKDKKARK